MATLVQKRTELDAKRKQLADLWAEAGDTIDMDKVTSINGTSSEKAKQFRERNDELTAIAEEVENLVAAENARRDAALDDDGDGDGGKGAPIPGGKGRGNERAERGLTLGELFVKSKTFKEFGGNRGPEVTLDFSKNLNQHLAIFPRAKALFDTTAYPPETTRLPGVQVTLGFQEPTVDDLIPELRTNQGAIKYMEETTATNGGAAVAEGGTKPESALAFTEKMSAVRKLATVMPVTDEMFADEPQMQDYVNQRLRFFLDLTREAQIVNGSGTAPNLRGILNTSGIQTQAKGADPTPDAVYKAMTLIRTGAFLAADATVWNPADWQEVKLLRTADGIYIWGSPADGGPDRIWGLRAVQTTALPVGTALVGAFNASSAKFRRSEMSFAVSDQHADFFITNKLMLRVEERLAFVVFRPAGFCTVTGV
jgi:hypothetical protein